MRCRPFRGRSDVPQRRQRMPVPSRAVSGMAVAVAVVAMLALGACAPRNTNTTYTSADIGRSAEVSYGVIVSMRPVTIQGGRTGVGTLGGAAAGATAGS